jgi:hypothetical protein
LASETKVAGVIAPPGFPRALKRHLALSTRHIQGIVSSSGPPGSLPAPGRVRSLPPPGRVRIQVLAGGPPACFAAARPAPPWPLGPSSAPPKR